jgi:cellulose synthase/poly-beta-1,6-N-acetylglucosamine synthase-like glycosyltransferase
MLRKASFIIPAWNAEAWLAETLESVLEQTRNDVEAIVVDDGSTDDTWEVAAFYAKMEPRVRLIRQENQGRSAARNAGNAAADSDIIMVLDSDDLALPDRANETIAFFEANPEISVFYSSFQLIDPLGGRGPVEKAAETGLDRVRETLLFGIGHSTLAYRKSVAEAVKYTSGDFSDLCIDDWKFQLDALRAGYRFGYSPKTLALYRVIPKKRDEKRIEQVKRAALN